MLYLALTFIAGYNLHDIFFAPPSRISGNYFIYTDDVQLDSIINKNRRMVIISNLIISWDLQGDISK